MRHSASCCWSSDDRAKRSKLSKPRCAPRRTDCAATPARRLLQLPWARRQTRAATTPKSSSWRKEAPGPKSCKRRPTCSKRGSSVRFDLLALACAASGWHREGEHRTWRVADDALGGAAAQRIEHAVVPRSEEHTSELQSLTNLVCRLLLEKKKT